ncbi:glycosyltransferase family 4 protein [Aestuariibacter sp. A3R04]|uniref:glycosyltransferase family 4 protein n=1 Tax=Aestuariibacter sp. A3R04 TaxID=2841571 RepID=UPI001C081F87|nr:glycosyltransferase family 4 protein [Aestuariibacter sp. A3R04]MBU3020748.1 glycosyltransferase family 4 protein [Aestuariibacter sp. A3R04]
MTIHVLHIELGRHLYGGAKQVVYLLNALNSTAITSTLVCPTDSDIAKLHLPHCRTIPVPYGGDIDVCFPLRLKALVTKYKPDIIHVHSRRGADVWGGLTSIVCNIPAICTRRVDNPEGKMARYKYQCYDAVVSISHGVQRIVTPHCNKQIQQVVHSAVDTADFHHRADRNWFNAQFSIPENYKVIANFAQLIPRKGQADIILAMKNVCRRVPNVICLLFGKGKQASYYQALIDKHDLEHCVRLCGFTEDVPKILPNIDILVHPAYAEGLGIILLQAGACGKPVISSPVGGIPEIIEHGKTGWMTTPGDVSQLEHAIVHLLRQPREAEKLGSALREHVTRHFTPSAMAVHYESLYQQLLNQPACRRSS